MFPNKKIFIGGAFVLLAVVVAAAFWYLNFDSAEPLPETTVIANALCPASELTDNAILADRAILLKKDFALNNAALSQLVGSLLEQENAESMHAFLIECFGEEGAMRAEGILCGTIEPGSAVHDGVELTNETVTTMGDYVNTFLAQRGTAIAAIPAYVSAVCHRTVPVEEAYGNFVGTFSELGLSTEQAGDIMEGIFFAGENLKTLLGAINRESDYLKAISGLCR